LNLFDHDHGTITDGDIADAFAKLGIARGDCLFAHTSLVHFGRPACEHGELLAAVNECFRDAVGESGTIGFPTFTYSFCKGEDYDTLTSRSDMGSFNEYFRTLPDVRRTLHPLFSAAVAGAKRDDWCDVGSDSFGPDSIFAKLVKDDAWLVCFGVDAMTFVHHVEQCRGVNYRFHKQFSGNIILDGRPLHTAATFFCRRLDWEVTYDLRRLFRDLEAAGMRRRVAVGPTEISAVRARHVYDVICRGLFVDPYYLLAGNPCR